MALTALPNMERVESGSKPPFLYYLIPKIAQKSHFM